MLPDPVGIYARQVVAGKVPANHYHRAAAARHLRDLEDGVWVFDRRRARSAIEFFPQLRHFKGEWAGQALELMAWQAFLTGSLFGWVEPRSRRRRFRVAYIEVPRSNGKSTLLAGWAILLTAFDDEPAAEVYCAATKREQARIVLDTARGLVLATPGQLRPFVAVSRHAVTAPAWGGKLEAVSADAQKLDGLRPHGVVIDELHAHPTSEVVDVMHSALGGRRQPVIAEITTAGVSRESICFEHHTYSVNVLTRALEDPSWFAFVTGIDEGDAWQEEGSWAKANPNYGVSVTRDDLEKQARQAAGMPARQYVFRQKRLNEWLQTAAQWIDRTIWDAQAQPYPTDPAWFAGRPCYGGLDLSAVSDLTGWCLAFPTDEPDQYVLRWRLWVPEAQLQGRMGASYRAWAQTGHLTVIPGAVIQYDQVRADILEDAGRFQVVDLNVDRLFQAAQLSNELAAEGLRVFGMGQGFLSMAPAMREFERLLGAQALHHGGHPVIRWMVENLVVRRDPAGNLKPDKEKSSAKIDGLVAAVMALDRATRHRAPSAYADSRLLVV